MAGRSRSQGRVYRSFVNISHAGGFTVSWLGKNMGHSVRQWKVARSLSTGRGKGVSRQRQRSAAPVPSPSLLKESKSRLETGAETVQVYTDDE